MKTSRRRTRMRKKTLLRMQFTQNQSVIFIYFANQKCVKLENPECFSTRRLVVPSVLQFVYSVFVSAPLFPLVTYSFFGCDTVAMSFRIKYPNLYLARINSRRLVFTISLSYFLSYAVCSKWCRISHSKILPILHFAPALSEGTYRI